jgi:hypothetical protein
MLVASLSSLLTALIRQAQSDAEHDDLEAKNARLFLRDLRSGRLPEWMADVVTAARGRVVLDRERYAPRLERSHKHNGGFTHSESPS